MTIRCALGWAAIIGLLCVLLWTSWKGPDVFYHLALGRAVLETGTFQPPDQLLITQPAYSNIYWFFQIVLWAIWPVAGVVGISLFFVALWLGVGWLWARTAEIHLHPVVGLPLALLVVLVVQQRFDPRPEVVSYLFLAAQVGWIVRWNPKDETPFRIAVLFFLTEALWVNVHGYFVFGPMLVALRLVVAVLGREGWSVIRRVAVLLGVTLIATLISPFGFGAWRFVLTLAVFLREMGRGIAEFGPPVGAFLKLWTVWLFWFLWVATIAAGVWLSVRRKLDLMACLLAVPGLLLSSSSIRNIPLLPILAAPLWRDVLREMSRSYRFSAFKSSVPLGVGALAIGLAIWIVTGGFFSSLATEREFGVQLRPHAFPIRAGDYLSRHGGSARIFNSAADGGYLELLFDNLTVCMDSRYIEADPVQRYFRALTDPAAFARLDDELNFDAALLKVVDSGPLVLNLLHNPEWEMVWGDLHRVLLVRKSSPLSKDWPLEGFHLESGDDLSQRVHGMAAIQWTAILIEVGDRDFLIEGLTQLGGAERVPSFVVQYALQYGLMNKDREILNLAKAMAPRLVALAPEHEQAVEQLLAAARDL